VKNERLNKKMGLGAPDKHTQYVSEHIGVNKTFVNEGLSHQKFSSNPKESASPQVGEKEPIKKTPSKRGRKRHGQQTLSSITGVHPKRTHGFGLWKGERGLHTIRLDNKLYKAFKPVAIANYGSICRPLEAFMASVIASHPTPNELRVHPSNTVEIGKLVIERNVRPRRKLVEEVSDVPTCDYANCEKEAIAIGIWRKKHPLHICQEHYAEAKKLFWEWSELKLLEASP